MFDSRPSFKASQHLRKFWRCRTFRNNAKNSGVFDEMNARSAGSTECLNSKVGHEIAPLRRRLQVASIGQE